MNLPAIDLPPPVQSLLDAANANDTDRFLSCFSEDGVVDDWGREFRGSDEIRSWSDREFIGAAVSLRPTTVTVRHATTVTETSVVAEVGGHGFNGPSTFTFHTGAAHVARMEIRA